jgi:hypothetical protein
MGIRTYYLLISNKKHPFSSNNYEEDQVIDQFKIINK